MDKFVKRLPMLPSTSTSEITEIPTPSTSKSVRETQCENMNVAESDAAEYSSSNEQKSIIKTIKKRYPQKYNTGWENEFVWCKKAPNSKYPYCILCNKEIRGNRAHLNRHQQNAIHLKNETHKKNTVAIDVSIKKTFLKNETLVKQGELKLAVFIAEHDLSFKTMEHLPNLIKSICKDSEIAKEIKCSRTKTTEIINNTIGPYVKNQIVDDINRTTFSIIIDETTDVSTNKCLAILVRYFSIKLKKVRDSFLGLLELNDGSTAENIFNAILLFFNSNNINIENMVGFSADNCSTMMGQLNGVRKLLTDRLPHLVVVGCTSHWLNLCSSNACLKLPRSVEDFVRDIYSHFNLSVKRLNILKEFQEFCDLKPHRLLRPSQTRWLSLQQVVDRILLQYDALVLYFTNAVFEDQTHKTDNILSALKNKMYKMYLLFLSYVLKIVNVANVDFQSEKPRLHQILPRISALYKQILKNYMTVTYVNSTNIHIIDPNDPRHFVSIENMYLGFQVQEIIDNSGEEINDKDLHDFRLRCLQFYIELSSQIKNRFPFGDELYQQLTWLDPINIFSENKVISIIKLARKFPNIVSHQYLENLNLEWRLLSELPENKFNNQMDLEELILELDSSKNPLGVPLFPTLCKFLKNISCLPHGSAAAERVFSSLNLIKRKNRNCLSTSTCQNLLLTKEITKTLTCFDWEPPSDLLKQYKR
ncbi:zinc finger protein 862-like [Diabrotica undecimpunctata]|uniref:zinc finger protein 862-like n=1 Tax=Diabrotica undecimpunctata TaxID=50387 RepID=UPI003B638675